MTKTPRTLAYMSHRWIYQEDKSGKAVNGKIFFEGPVLYHCSKENPIAAIYSKDGIYELTTYQRIYTKCKDPEGHDSNTSELVAKTKKFRIKIPEGKRFVVLRDPCLSSQARSRLNAIEYAIPRSEVFYIDVPLGMHLHGGRYDISESIMYDIWGRAYQYLNEDNPYRRGQSDWADDSRVKNFKEYYSDRANELLALGYVKASQIKAVDRVFNTIKGLKEGPAKTVAEPLREGAWKQSTDEDNFENIKHKKSVAPKIKFIQDFRAKTIKRIKAFEDNPTAKEQVNKVLSLLPNVWHTSYALQMVREFKEVYQTYSMPSDEEKRKTLEDSIDRLNSILALPLIYRQTLVKVVDEAPGSHFPEELRGMFLDEAPLGKGYDVAELYKFMAVDKWSATFRDYVRELLNKNVLSHFVDSEEYKKYFEVRKYLWSGDFPEDEKTNVRQLIGEVLAPMLKLAMDPDTICRNDAAIAQMFDKNLGKGEDSEARYQKWKNGTEQYLKPYKSFSSWKYKHDMYLTGELSTIIGLADHCYQPNYPSLALTDYYWHDTKRDKYLVLENAEATEYVTKLFANSLHSLRLAKDGKNIETSGSAYLDRRIGHIAYKRFKDGKLENGQHIGSYTLGGVEVIDGLTVLKIGCHRIPWKEIEDIAVQLNWSNTEPEIKANE